MGREDADEKLGRRTGTKGRRPGRAGVPHGGKSPSLSFARQTPGAARQAGVTSLRRRTSVARPAMGKPSPNSTNDAGSGVSLAGDGFSGGGLSGGGASGGGVP